jgi:hypothetical protein
MLGNASLVMLAHTRHSLGEILVHFATKHIQVVQQSEFLWNGGKMRGAKRTKKGIRVKSKQVTEK